MAYYRWWWIASFDNFNHDDMFAFPYCLAAAMQAAATHLELGVATSANKIANALALYFCAASLYYSYWFMRESWLWHVLSRVDSFFFGDTSQNAKQLFFTRLSKMMNYCVMRECENIHSWISLSGDLAFSHQHGIYDFIFPKRFLEITCRDLTSFLLQLI
jgi:hypothetical protein